MRAFNVAFLTINLLLLALILFLHFDRKSADQRHFKQLKPGLMKLYNEFGMQLPDKNPQNLDELLAPLERLTIGLSK